MRYSLLVLWMVLSAASTYAEPLQNDLNQPAILEADHMELDLRNGVRVYRGNVVFRQGTIRLDCDVLTTHFEDDELQQGMCVGSPGKFRQGLENSRDDFAGQAMEITLEGAENRVILRHQATVTQGQNTISGTVITYDMTTERIAVNQGMKRNLQGENGVSSSTVSATKTGKPPSRAKLIIQPPGD